MTSTTKQKGNERRISLKKKPQNRHAIARIVVRTIGQLEMKEGQKYYKLHNTSALSVRNSWSRVANKWARSTWQNKEDSSTSSFWNLSTKSKWLMTNQHGWFHYQQSIISKLLILLSERKILERIIKDESAGVCNSVLFLRRNAIVFSASSFGIFFPFQLLPVTTCSVSQKSLAWAVKIIESGPTFWMPRLMGQKSWMIILKGQYFHWDLISSCFQVLFSPHSILIA